MFSKTIRLFASPNRRAAKVCRPVNAFIVFANEKRPQIKEQKPFKRNQEISQELSQLWKTLSEVEKKVYYSRAAVIRENHKEENPGYTYVPSEARKQKAERLAVKAEKRKIRLEAESQRVKRVRKVRTEPNIDQQLAELRVPYNEDFQEYEEDLYDVE